NGSAMGYAFRNRLRRSHPIAIPVRIVTPFLGSRLIIQGQTHVQNFLAPNLALRTCRVLRRGFTQQYHRPGIHLPGIPEVGVPALVPFRDRIAGTHGGHSAFPGAESPAGRGARLHCHACRPRDRHHPRRIRARCATTRRGGLVTCGRLDKLAQAAHRFSVTDSTAMGSAALAARHWALTSDKAVGFLHTAAKETAPRCGAYCNTRTGATSDQAVAGSAGVTGVEAERGPRAKRVASILRRSSTPCPLPVTLSTA